MPISIMILLLVLIAIAFRNVVNVAIPIWSIMLAGALLAILFQQITPMSALRAVDIDIMLYLFGVFTICQAAEASGYLEHLTERLFCFSSTGRHALIIIVFVLGLSSALLMNDTIAIVGTPIILQLCKIHRSLTKPLLLALAYAISIGSVITPIGNPQNLLIAIKGNLTSPFIDFMKVMAIPTAINLVIAYFFIYFIFKKELDETIEKNQPKIIKDHHTVTLTKISLMLMLLLIALKVIGDQVHIHLSFFYIALVPALLVLCFAKERWQLIKGIDWGTLIFFVSMFILMQSVWDSDFLQTSINRWKPILTQTHVILVASAILSQFISNVPLVALYMPLLMNLDLQQTHLLALAAGSTIAGNISLLGAASNIIILQNAERRGNKGFGFLEFTKIGLPLTVINMLVYFIFL